MSDDAKTLMHWIGNAIASVADNEADSAYCRECASRWAAHIIGQGC